MASGAGHEGSTSIVGTWLPLLARDNIRISCGPCQQNQLWERPLSPVWSPRQRRGRSRITRQAVCCIRVLCGRRRTRGRPSPLGNRVAQCVPGSTEVLHSITRDGCLSPVTSCARGCVGLYPTHK